MLSVTMSVFLSLYRKTIEVKIIDDEEYEKNKTFSIELGEPVLLEIGQKHGKLSVNVFCSNFIYMYIKKHLALCEKVCAVIVKT